MTERRLIQSMMPVLIALSMGALAMAQQRFMLPQPYATPSVMNEPHVVPRPSGAPLRVPPGFSINAWGEGFAKPRFMLQGSKDEVLIADSGAGMKDGVVYVVPGNRRSTERKALIEHLDRPYGLALWKQYLYVAEAESVKRYVYD